MPRDFLSGLIDRAFQRAPVLARRRPSIFEPAFGESSGGWIDTERERPLEPTMAPVAPAPSSPASIPRVARASEGLDQEEVRTEPARPASPRSDSFQIAERRGDRAAPERVPAVERTVERLIEPRQVEHTIERQIESRETLLEHFETRVEKILPPRTAVENVARREEWREAVDAALSSDVVSPAPRVVEPARHVEDTRVPSVMRMEVPAAVARTLSPIQRQPAQNAAAATPPTIQVTIGRVELRAPQNESGQRTGGSRPRPPKLALDDYMRGRNGGLP
jgi:hypothetical protein